MSDRLIEVSDQIMMKGLIALVLLLVTSAYALDYNQVTLRAEAYREVANDVANASVYVEFNDTRPTVLADRLNRATAQGFEIVKRFPAVRAWSSGNSSYPVYNEEQRLVSWRGRAEIKLESNDFRQLSELIAQLQTVMQLDSLSFGVAPSTRQKAETELMGDAVQAFHERADVLRQNLGGKSYRLVSLNIDTQNYVPPTPMMRATVARTFDQVFLPSMESGKVTLAVGVQGTIQVTSATEGH